jgi:hypothetical protein
MRQPLLIHPNSRCTAVTQIEVEVVRQHPGILSVHFVVTGNVRDLALPPTAAPTRTDDLWRHTCFETFVRAAPSGAYYEFNFAPSKQWATYRFTGYRSGPSVASAIRTPKIEVHSNETCCELQASLQLSGLPDLPIDASWHLGLSAVIEEIGGSMSYWALAHPPGRADFHHSDCFSLELPAA